MTTEKVCLIVDDSDVIREITARIVRDFGLKAEQAETAIDALGKCKAGQVDVVILDWDLPGIGALDFLRGAAELDGEKKPVIILCATENDPQQFTLAKAAGAAHHVLKPFDSDSLAAVLAEAGVIASSANGSKSKAS